jgi:hypothetical protein
MGKSNVVPSPGNALSIRRRSRFKRAPHKHAVGRFFYFPTILSYDPFMDPFAFFYSPRSCSLCRNEEGAKSRERYSRRHCRRSSRNKRRTKTVKSTTENRMLELRDALLPRNGESSAKFSANFPRILPSAFPFPRENYRGDHISETIATRE